jgi:chromosome segregation protein
MTGYGGILHFKKLEIVGFKSFAGKTLIEFEPGVTAVVGPNGCGKSNVSDAIRWVLGEQSAKSLRGSSMEDVIFNGSANQEPLNFAEVSLTLSNESRIFSIDFEEVTITRRLYRSGESEYLLNKNAVRLRDIHDLLLGTGIGTESYSVIEQGKMDAILNSKPEDRRVIFEEAAGITKFKSKKKEALRKLEQTDANLLRINDIVQEVRRQISSVERQAKKAQQYKIEFEKMKSLELAVASKEFVLFDQDRRNKEQNLEILKREEADCFSVLHAIEEKCDEERGRVHRIEETLQASGAEEVWAGAEIRKNQDRILLNRERIGELAERKGNLVHQMDGAKERLLELETETLNLNNELERAKAEETEGSHFLGAVQGELEGVQDHFEAAQQEVHAIQSAIQDLVRRNTMAENSIARIRTELASIGAQWKRLKQEEELLLKEIQKTDERLQLPLFDSEDGTALSTLENRLREFREKIFSILRGWFERQIVTPDSQEQEILDLEIQRFSDEIGKLQRNPDTREIENRHLREARGRAEEKLSGLARELDSFSVQEASLRERERNEEAGLPQFTEEESALLQRRQGAQALYEDRQRDKEAVLVRIAETRSRQSNVSSRREKAERDRNWMQESRRGQEELLTALQRESEESLTKKQSLEEENLRLESEQKQLGVQRDEILRKVEGLRRDRDQAASSLAELEHERREKNDFLNQARERVHAFQMESAEIRFAIDRLKERVFNAYQVDLTLQTDIAETEKTAGEYFALPEGMPVEEAKQEVQKYRDKLNRMGPVNLVAIEEHEEMTQRFNFLTQQEQDLLKAKDDLHKAIQKINRTTRELFSDTFAKVRAHFSEYYRLLFGGGSAELVLLDENDVLESGIDIVARPPGKKLQNISLLSGGEKALTAVALLFALFKVKPSPFCVLDEIDAPLDESNVDRFCNVLKEFVLASQFIVITHNKRTMNLADAIYGVTMPETGISKIVSVRFSPSSRIAASAEKAEVETL